MMKKTLILKILFIIFFLVIIFYIIDINFFSKNLNYKKTLCQFRFNKISKDNCYVEIIEKVDAFEICPLIQGEFSKNYCYLKNRKCEFISNSYYNYLCQRMGMRPHMWEFITRPNQPLNQNLLDIKECGNFVGYERLFCEYNEIILEQNMSDIINYCESFSDELIVGECKFQVQISQVPNLGFSTKNKIDFFMHYCQEIINPEWKSECYFLLADELSFLEDHKNYFEEIGEFCRKSNDANNFGCFNHVTINLMLSDAKFFCDLLGNSDKVDCYKGYGYKVGTNLTLNEVPKAINSCRKLNDELLNQCITGLIWSISTTSVPDKVEFFIDYCSLMPEGSKSLCYKQFGNEYHTFKKEGKTSIEIMDYCNMVDLKFQKNCIKGFAQGLDMAKKFDTKLEVEECLKLDINYQEVCMMQLISQLTYHQHTDSEVQISKCNLFPLNFQGECRNKINFESKLIT